MPTKTFWTEPTNRRKQWLRRYSSSTTSKKCPNMPGEYSYHNEMYRIEDIEDIKDAEGYGIPGKTPGHDDPSWPDTCSCGYKFEDKDEWQLFDSTIYVDKVGKEYDLHNAVPGMMWDAWWAKSFYLYGDKKSEDGIVLMVMTPGGEWCVDGRANNCTKKDDHVHFCWCRHGNPKDENVTVDKNGNTCAAGAGSILIGKYHGFLQNGLLTD